MLEDLITFNPSFVNDRFEALLKRPSRAFLFEGLSPYFKEDDNMYKACIKSKDANLEDININVEDEMFINISYIEKKEDSVKTVSIKEKLPEDCDTSTLEANFENGELIITVKKRD